MPHSIFTPATNFKERNRYFLILKKQVPAKSVPRNMLFLAMRLASFTNVLKITRKAVMVMSPGELLSAEQAIEIYKRKPRGFGLHKACDEVNDGFLSNTRGSSVPLAVEYGVSPKTIRDIWNRRTWAFATLQLWLEEQPDIMTIEANGPSTIRVRTRHK